MAVLDINHAAGYPVVKKIVYEFWIRMPLENATVCRVETR